MFGSLVAALSISPAQACGGFFCSNVPVEQEGEDIVFAVDEERGETTVHVQINYTGPAEEFAWIVPVPQNPEILLSNDRLFQELGYRTQPTFQLQYEELFDCEGGGRGYYGSVADYGYSSTPLAAPSEDGGVSVVSTEKVGPYDTVVLQATSSTALLDWLQDNGYQLPNNLDAVLNPYIAEQAYFVALKLRKDVDVGALQPIAMTYSGTGASVPIQLTSIAATEDMRLHVYVLGTHRSVPESYFHVQINDLVVNWWSYGSNYEDAITVAADEAGGHAFATDYAGPSDVMAAVLWSEGRYDIASLAASPDPYTFFDRLLSMGFVGDAQLLALFREFLPMPEALAEQGTTEQDFYNCLSCYSQFVDGLPFDAAAFAAAIDEAIVAPLHDAQTLIDELPVLTRMTSSVSPIEMTVDPTFVFNADMDQDVTPLRVARLQMLCGNGGAWDSSPRRLVLEDGRAYDLPSERWFQQAGMTEYEYLEELMKNYAIVIEQTSASGQPTVMVDHTDEARADAEAFNAESDTAVAGGCGCSGGGSGGAAALFLSTLGLVVRRRKA